MDRILFSIQFFLSLLLTKIFNMDTKICCKCKETKEITEFYGSANDHHAFGRAALCKVCFNLSCMERWKATKVKAISYKGGKCVDCSLNLEESHFSVFEFHHLNPTEKEANWTKLRLKSWDKIINELDKCVLLCANCHRIRHYSIP